MTSLRSHAVSGGAWVAASAISRQGLQFLLQVILARILLPAEFSPVVLLYSFLAISQLVADMGISAAIIQKQEIEDRTLDAGFWGTATVTFLISSSLFFAAGYISRYFSDPVLEPLTRILAIAFFPEGVLSFFRGLFYRSLSYSKLFLVELVIGVVGFIATLGLAHFGFSSSSLAYGRLAGVSCGLIAAISMMKYVPKSFGTFAGLWGLLKFGMWVAISRITGQTAGHVDKFVVAKLLPGANLGNYHFAHLIATLVPNLLTDIADKTLFPLYSRIAEDKERVTSAYFRTLRISIVLLCPVSLCVIVFADPIVRMLFGEHWAAAVPLVHILGIAGLIQSIGGGIFGSIIYASGKGQASIIVSLVRIIGLPLCIFLGSRWGLTGIAWGFVVYGICGRLINQYILDHFVGISLESFFGACAKPVLNLTVLYVLLNIVNQTSQSDAGFEYFFGIIYSTMAILAYALSVRIFLPDVFADISFALITFKARLKG